MIRKIIHLPVKVYEKLIVKMDETNQGGAETRSVLVKDNLGNGNEKSGTVICDNQLKDVGNYEVGDKLDTYLVKEGTSSMGLKLLHVINDLRDEDDDELVTKNNSIHDRLLEDEDQFSKCLPSGVNSDDHHSVFNAIYENVCNNSQSDVLLRLLHMLLLISNKDQESGKLWGSIETAVRQVIDTPQPCIFRPPILPSSTGIPPAPPPTAICGMSPPAPPTSIPPAPPPLRLFGIPTPAPPASIPPAPPPPGLFRIPTKAPPASIPPAPRPPAICGMPAPAPPASIPPAPPPPGVFGLPPPPGAGTNIATCQAVQEVKRTPSRKMMFFYWNKIPEYVAKADGTVWKAVSSMENSIPIDYDAVEELFCQSEKSTPNKVANNKNRDKVVLNEGAPNEGSKRQQMLLLPPSKSMKVNVFLKQFKGIKSHEIVAMIKDGDVHKIESERLMRLQEVLPVADDLNSILEYSGDPGQLGDAEQFYLELQALDNFKLRIDSMVVGQDLSKFRPLTEAYIKSCKGILENDSLKVFLGLVLHTGNFINACRPAGNAVGFRFNSINKLMVARANKQNVTLLHYLVNEAEKENRNAVSFVNELYPVLTLLTSANLEGMTAEISDIDENVTSIDSQLKEATENVKLQFQAFIDRAKLEITELRENLREINMLSTQLAEYFCEDKETFELDTFFGEMRSLCKQVEQCQKEKREKIRRAQSEIKPKPNRKANAEVQPRDANQRTIFQRYRSQSVYLPSSSN